MPKYKLHYFDMKGKGELIRLLFAYAGEEYEDVRYSPDERPGVQRWDEKAKAEMPLGQMPVLEIDGEKYCQQSSVARHLAKKFDLMGQNEKEELKVDMVQEAMWLDLASKAIQMKYEADEGRKAEMKQKLINDLPQLMEKIENWIEGDYVLSSGISLADLVIFDLSNLMATFLPDIEYPPKLKKVRDNVMANERIKAWMESSEQS